MRWRVVALAAALLVLLPTVASAQAVDLRVPEAASVELGQARLAIRDERIAGGGVLMAGGLLSLVGGGAVSIAGALDAGDPFLLGFGVGAAGWGLINAALSFGLLDVSGAAHHSIERERSLRGDERSAARERVLRSQHRSATLFAVNAGLDIAYIASAALLFFFADSVLSSPQDAGALRGYAMAQLSQGAFLLVFDLVEWAAASGWADGIGATPR